MARALELGARGLCGSHPNPSVGCVVLRDGEIVGEGFHARAGQPHAEPLALAQAGARARGAELFVTLEPCAHHGRTPPCVDAVIAAGVRKVWAALADPNPDVDGGGFARLRAAGIEVEVGLLAEQAQRLHRGFLSRMRRGRPWLTLKLAASLDGRTALANGQSRWITGSAARAEVHRRRAEAGAVLTGIGTVLADDPQLTCRESSCAYRGSFLRQPDRIVLDADARAPATAKVWAEGARRFWFTAADGPTPAGVERIAVPRAGSGLDLGAVLTELARREVNEVLAECGPTLAGGLLRSACVDELVLYLAPSLLGHEARPLVTLPGPETLEQRLRWRWRSVERLGEDLRLVLEPDSLSPSPDPHS
ncbi:bifunctional diaminohydroxyphosphoribosylaminopyrimidine deaminase/5-amino-6-(5-phosphoribosylamino)uracil reductase RibD [Sinimarinibacterium thermocellulolyticum]|uniref:Riboflavin biosynthesis protein RibD n=1 Tax=Sinimarinibacterium thermocellulolyticum TaxID=3170016 RepID=A0ABV2AAJ3_9GAMM